MNSLGDGDAWYCPECKRKQEVVKRMGLWSLPDVLIIHLKRFRQTKNGQNNKLSTMVEFPLENCDMSPFVTEREPQKTSATSVPTDQPNAELTTTTTTTTTTTNQQPKIGASKLAALFKPKKSVDNNAATSPPSEANNRNNTYDLYAVCNHHGDDLQGGHYTATCR